MDLKDKICLITGASRGLGAALAEALGAEGAHIIALARSAGALEEIDDRIQAQGGSATLVPLDLNDTDGIRRMGQSLHDRWGGIDLWIHTAIHAAPLTPANHIDGKDFAKSVDTKITATKDLIESVDPLLRAKKGRAIYISDPEASGKFFGSYGATKAAQMALARSWQAETVNSGPWVHILTPPPMPTATRARFFPGEDRDALTPSANAAETLLSSL